MAPFRKNRRPQSDRKPYLAASNLSWSTVHIPTEAQAGGAGVTESQFFDGLHFQGDDFMGLQEVEDVNVVYKDGNDGSRMIRFQSVEKKGEKRKRVEKEKEELEEEEEDDEEPLAEAEEDADDLDDEDLAAAFSHAGKLGFNMDDDENDDEFDDSLLPAWASLPLHPSLKRALHNINFNKPTEIQAKSLPPALGLAANSEEDDSDAESDNEPSDRKRDVVGVSQTGSGKTLAYGLPILQWLFETAPDSNRMPEEHDVDPDGLPRPLGALILCPTRELAIQVSTHLSKVIKSSCRSSPDSDVSKLLLLRRPHVAVVCGGMSELKQKRMLETRGGADIVVATPGRLWEMARLDDHLAARIKRTRFLVLDEADRMVQVGHFKEMKNILNLVNRAMVDSPDGEDETTESTSVKPNEEMQTFVFSATLSKALQVNLKRKKVKAFKKKKGKSVEGSTLDDLMDCVDFRDEEPVIVDLTPGQSMPAGLLESKIECLHTDKDLYLYYFLLRYPGRTLVFLNSIDGIRRLVPILQNLKVPVFPLHSQLQQKQRLKALERFKTTTSGVLLATDVAARGLDIPAVDHVVHYQLARSADTYVHRSGRTARAGGSGVSLSLIEPKEKTLFVQLHRALRRDASISSMPIEYSFLTPLKPRMVLARQIDQAEHKTSKAAHEEAWIRDLAKEADLDLDADETVKRKGVKVRMLKRELEEELNTPISRKGVSHRYITSGRTNLAEQMLNTHHHDTILGLPKSSAENDLRAASALRPSKKKLKSTAPKPAASTPTQAQIPKAKRKS